MTAEIEDAFASPRPAAREMSAVAIANRNEIAGAGIEALLRASGHRVIAHCSDEDDLLRLVDAYDPKLMQT